MQRLFWTALLFGVVASDPGSAPAPGEAQKPAVSFHSELRSRFDPARIVNRIMSFDADADGRITKDELPERMQALVARHDRNNDGVLTADEVRTSADSRLTVSGGGGAHAGLVAGLPGVINDLKLRPSKREQALAIVKDQPAVRDTNHPASAEVYSKMRQLLDPEEYANFEAAVQRLTRHGVMGGIVAGVAR